jgi:hypothetical protein
MMKLGECHNIALDFHCCEVCHKKREWLVFEVDEIMACCAAKRKRAEVIKDAQRVSRETARKSSKGNKTR